MTGSRGLQRIPVMEELAWMIWNAVSSISGEVSDRLVGLGLKALLYMRSRYRAGEKLQSLIERCPELSDEHLFMVRSLQLEFMTEFGDYGKQFAFYLEKGLLSEEQLLNALTNYGQRLLASGKLTETETLVSEVFPVDGQSGLQGLRRISAGPVLLLPGEISCGHRCF